MTNLERLTQMSADDMTKFIMRLIKGDEEHYDYQCGNCPVTDCGNFEPEERCCWGVIMTWLDEEIVDKNKRIIDLEEWLKEETK